MLKDPTQKRPGIYILGRDNVGGSIDQNRELYTSAFHKLKHKVTASPLKADIVFSVWWNKLLDRKTRFFTKTCFWKPVVARFSNDPWRFEKQFSQIRRRATAFIYAHSRQREWLLDQGIESERLFYNPVYVDESLFQPSATPVGDIAKSLDLDGTVLSSSLVIGSFQNDSVSSLRAPKHVKDPDTLLEIVQRLMTHERVMLLLAGPRRHYIVNQCLQRGIPYLFVGDERYHTEMKDDLTANNLSLKTVAQLYQLIDLYIVSSRSESGPRGTLEASLTRKPVLSTDVGVARDMLHPFCIFRGPQDAADKARELIQTPTRRSAIAQENFAKVSRVNNFTAFCERADQVIQHCWRHRWKFPL